LEVLRRAAFFLLLAPLIAMTGCADSRPRPVTILTDGCVTASGDQYVLTDLEPGEAEPSLQRGRIGSRPYPTTEAYVLIGADQQLRTLVGRRVRVAGEASPAQIAEIRMLSPLVRVGPRRTVATSGMSPKVGVQEVLRMEVHRLRVISASPTGDSCLPAMPTSRPATTGA
jgi:hypothetical protein